MRALTALAARATQPLMTRTIDYLQRLVGFPTVSRESNLDLIEFVRNELASADIESVMVPNEDGRKANLWVTIGPKDRPGVVLSGHTDVVPVEGQAWSSDPFALRRRNDNFYGRGTADMKGFLASCLAMAQQADRGSLAIPIHLAFSYDEEVGCLGVRRLIAMLGDLPVRPRLCVIGEPTLMQAVTAHKGKIGMRVVCHGLECHSSLAPLGVNAIHMAADLIAAIRQVQADIADHGARDGEYEIAHTTLHVGKIAGGEALNIVPSRCSFDFEIRHLPADDPEPLIRRIRDAAAGIEAQCKTISPDARIEFMPLASYPALETPHDSQAVDFVRRLTGGNSTGKISFGTEGGLYSRDLGVPAVVYGPGSIAVAHKPDEYISEAQLAACDAMLGRLVQELRA